VWGRRTPKKETIQEIKMTVEPLINDCNYSDLYFNIVRPGRKIWISAYITFEKDDLFLRKFKILQPRCIAALAQKYSDFYFKLLPEIEFNIDEMKQLEESNNSLHKESCR